MTWYDILKDFIFPAALALIGFLIGRYAHKKDQKKDKADAENNQLRIDNASLKEQLALYEDVEQSTTGNYLIMKKNGWAICPTCWTKDHNPVPIYGNNGGSYVCGGCGKAGTYNHQQARERDRRIDEHNRQTAEYYSF